MDNNKKVKLDGDIERLLRIHQQHFGLYARVANKVGMSPAYVSLVAHRKRENENIMAELVKELRNICG